MYLYNLLILISISMDANTSYCTVETTHTYCNFFTGQWMKMAGKANNVPPYFHPGAPSTAGSPQQHQILQREILRRNREIIPKENYVYTYTWNMCVHMYNYVYHITDHSIQDRWKVIFTYYEEGSLRRRERSRSLLLPYITQTSSNLLVFDQLKKTTTVHATASFDTSMHSFYHISL